MGRLSRFTQLLFGANAGGSRIAAFGSLAAGSPVAYSGSTVTPAEIQAESAAFLDAWDGALIGNNSPAVQDQNALDYLTFYQLSYLFQQGIPEYDGSTQYYSNSLVMGSTGTIYQAAGSPTLGSPYTASPWVVFAATRQVPQVTQYLSGSGTYTTPAGALYLEVEMAAGGGGGGGSTASTASPGGVTTFGGSSYLICFGGAGGGSPNVQTGGQGGQAQILGAGLVGDALNGGEGDWGVNVTINGTDTFPGGRGGGNALGPGGAGTTTTGQSPNDANTGGGGSGSTQPGGVSSGTTSSGGGGGGGVIRVTINNPASTFAYVVGAGGLAGTGGFGGGDGSKGRITVTAKFQ